LCVRPFDDWIACQWEDVATAKTVLPYRHDDRLNPFSGKWNFHYGDAMFKTRELTEICIDDFLSELRPHLLEGSANE
jgi:hypothetical protein